MLDCGARETAARTGVVIAGFMPVVRQAGVVDGVSIVLYLLRPAAGFCGRFTALVAVKRRPVQTDFDELRGRAGTH